MLILRTALHQIKKKDNEFVIEKKLQIFKWLEHTYFGCTCMYIVFTSYSRCFPM